MPRPVSIIVWRDAKTDPPKGQTRGVFVEFENGTVWTAFANTLPCEGSAWDGYDNVRRWAEIPVLSDLTDEDVRYAVEAYEKKALSSGAVDMRPFRARVDRLRAALGGEKEEA